MKNKKPVKIKTASLYGKFGDTLLNGGKNTSELIKIQTKSALGRNK